MKFRVDQRIAAPVDAVQEALLDPAFYARLGEAPTIDPPEVLEQRRDGDVVHLRIRYRFTGELNSVVKKAIDPKKLSWIEESEVRVVDHTSTFRMLPDHYPDRLRCSGTTRLSAEGDGTLRTVEADLVVRMPLVGGRVESAIVSGLREHLGLEAEILRLWLDG